MIDRHHIVCGVTSGMSDGMGIVADARGEPNSNFLVAFCESSLP